jgi:Helix-turn-helix domain
MQQTDIWSLWSRGELSDAEAQARSEAAYARNAAHRGGGGGSPKPLSAAVISGRIQSHRRDKHFGFGQGVPLDRNAKVRVMHHARALMRRTEQRKHYGVITAKTVAVLEALLWGFHNAATGRCFPSYETIADRAGCSRTMVYQAIRMLERAGVLTWVNRLIRVRERCAGLFGPLTAWRSRVVRTSNSYCFSDPASKFKFQTGTTNQVQQGRGRRADETTNTLAASAQHLATTVSKQKGGY